MEDKKSRTANFVDSILRPGGGLRLIEKTALEGDLELLKEAAALMIATGTQTDLSYVRYIIKVLAEAPRVDTVERAAQLVFELNSKPSLRSTASRLAACQNVEVLQQFLLKHLMDSTYVELMALLVQELVLRSQVGAIKEPAEQLWCQLREMKHPLAWLPLVLSPIERNITLTQYRTLAQVASGCYFESICGSFEEARPTEQTVLKKPQTHTSGRFELLRERLPAPAHLARCVEWKHPESKCEARIFDFLPAGVEFESTLGQLPLDCLRNFFREPEFRVTDMSDVFSIFFQAASCGDALSISHQYGAYGRLSAWQSMASCAGCVPEESFEQCCARVAECRWFDLNIDPLASTQVVKRDWFYRVIWDFCVICVHPSNATLAVLAATGTG